MWNRVSNIVIKSGLILLLCLMVTGSAWAVQYNLMATTGTVTMPDEQVITIWGFADCGTNENCTNNPAPQATLPGPVLYVNPGDALKIRLTNTLSEPVSLVMPGQKIIAPSPTAGGRSYTTETPAKVGSTVGRTTYEFGVMKPGTYLYESGTNPSKQVQMGLYGALIVRPAGYSATTNKIAYATVPGSTSNGTTFTRESVLVLSDIDPEWHRAVAAGQAYNAVYFNPKYWLINGKAYPDTQDILAKTGETLLLRYLNAGSQDHVMVTQGLSSTGIADDGYRTTYPQQTSTVLMNPGQTRDLLVQPTETGDYPLFDRRLDITNRDHFPGGMISMVRVIGTTLSGLSILSPVASFIATEGKKWTYDPIAVDPAFIGSPLSYSLLPQTGSTIPTGMTIDPATGRVSWVAIGTSGTKYAIVHVCSSASSTCADQSFSVLVNRNPVFDLIPADRTLSAGTPFSATIHAADADGNSITYSLLDVFAPLTINSSSGLITGTLVEPLTGDTTYTIQVQATDGVGGVATRVFHITMNAAAAAPGGGGGGTVGANSVTISPIEYGSGGIAITDFKFIVNVDNAPLVDPDTQTCDPACPGRQQYESNSPIAATGTVTSSKPQNATISLPDGRYFVTVLPGVCVPDTSPSGCNDRQMRDGGFYKLDGKHFSLPRDAGTPIVVELHPDPLPLSRVTVQVFQDSRSLDVKQDIAVEGVPSRNGVPDHFKIIVKDMLGDVSTDGLGNPICSKYDINGDVIPGTGGVCLTDDNGYIVIKNLVPNKYGVSALPPEGSGWIQTTTIEGTKSIDAWAEEGNDGLLREGVMPRMIFQGFVRPCSFGDNTDDCPTNDTPGKGTISGQIKRLQPSRPPFLQPDGTGDPVAYPWVGLNNQSGNGEYVALVRGDATGKFTINNVPDGFYQVVYWDDPQDFIVSFFTLSMPQLTLRPDGTTTSTRNVVVHDPRFDSLTIPDWYSYLHGTVYLDRDEDGVQNVGEQGLPLEYVETRFRDGSLLYSTLTDNNGHYEFKEFFPWLHWMIAGIGYTRLGDTGVHVVAGERLPLIHQNVVEERTDHGPELTIGTLGWAGESNRIDWGKKPYPLLGNAAAGNNYVAPNGGISGAVWYASTRNEEDIRFAAADDWEPGVPDLYLNLYERIVDPATGKTMTDPATGAAIKGRHMDTAITDHFNRPGAKPADCEYLDPITGALTNDPDCAELLYNWNQVKSGIWDGAYQFFYDCSDMSKPGQLLDPDAGQCRPLPAGTYLVELELPANYLLVTENDRNVINAGDTFVRTLRDPMPCVGPRYLVTDPDQPDYTENPVGTPATRVNDCSMKEVNVDAHANAAADFHIFTEVPIPARMRGLVTDNVNIEVRRALGWYGDKAGVPFIPVSIRDYAGKEIVRVYTDADGMFEVLLPTSPRANVPTPSGFSPNMLWVTANDPGTAVHPDPHYNSNYDSLSVVLDNMPGKMVLADIALTPVNGFLSTKNVDCGPDAATPQVAGVTSQPYGNNSGNIPVTLLGAGFGPSGSVTLNGRNLAITNWSDTSITATIPSGFAPGPSQLLVISANNKVSPTGITFHVRGGSYLPTVVTVGTSIQAAIDAAAPGSVIVIPPGTYQENLIVWKPVTLQGYGAGMTTVNGTYWDPILETLWKNKINTLSAGGSITLLAQPIQPLANTMAAITVLAKQVTTTPTGRVRIDGMSIQGARLGGGIYVNSFADNTEISNNIIQNNFGSSTGGVALGFPNNGDNRLNAPGIRHNQIVHNGSLGPTGGVGIFDGVNGAQIEDNLICANGTMASGGGISQWGTNMGTNPMRISRNNILFNWAFTDGGGISLLGPTPANPAAFSSGTGPVEIDSNNIQGNFAEFEGGGISLRAVGTFPIRITNNMIVNNVSSEQGGGLSIQDAPEARIINNTIAKNNSTSINLPLEPWAHPAGMVIYPNTTPLQNSLPGGSSTISNPYIFNNVFWDNLAYVWDTASTSLVPSVVYDLGVYVSTVKLSHVQNNLFTTTTLPAAVDSASATGNKLGQDPQFVGPYDTTLEGIFVTAAGELGVANPAVPVVVLYSPLFPTGDYHLLVISPAVNSGVSAVGAIAAPAKDYDSDARPFGPAYEIGADELNQLYVNSPDLKELNVSNPPVTAVAGSSFSVTETARNQGGGTTAIATITRYYLTHGMTGNPVTGDILLTGSRTVPPLVSGAQSTGTNIPVTIPSGTPLGTYSVLACADDTKQVKESSESNNCALSGTQVNVTRPVYPDYIETGVSTSVSTVVQGGSLSVTDTVQNQGAVSGGASTTRFYLSGDATWNAGDTRLNGSRSVGTLTASGISTGTTPGVTIPITTTIGTSYVLACADDLLAVAESNETNNCAASASLSVTAAPTTFADLAEIAVSNPPATTIQGGRFPMTDTVLNQGTAASGTSTTRYYLSINTTWETGDRLLSGTRGVVALAIGGASTGTVNVTLPTNTVLGTYYVLACADDTKVVAESSEINNCLASATQVVVSAPVAGVDLVESTLSNYTNAIPGGNLSVRDTVFNRGSAEAGGSTTRYYLTPTGGTTRILLTGSRGVGGLASGRVSTGTVAVTVPAGTALSTYTLSACADDLLAVAESNETNNCLSSGTLVSITSTVSLNVDLIETAVSSPPSSAAVGSSFSVSDTAKNQGTGTTGIETTTRYYLSSNTSIEGGDVRLTGTRMVAVLPAGASDSGSVTLTIPTMTLGTYYLLACSDNTNVVPETNQGNNCKASTGTVLLQ